ncbi:MAG TPA: hypothetical protein VFZ11_04705, partial [Gemmatimonadaceae bacterium]
RGDGRRRADRPALLLTAALGAACASGGVLPGEGRADLDARGRRAERVLTERSASDSAARVELALLRRDLELLDSIARERERSYERLRDAAGRVGVRGNATRPDRARAAYAGILASAVGANLALRLDPDPCPGGERLCFRSSYRDEWLAPDKFSHLNAASFLSTTATQLGVRDRDNFLVTCAAAAAFELTQGYASWRDAAAGCAGAGASIAARRAVVRWLR